MDTMTNYLNSNSYLFIVVVGLGTVFLMLRRKSKKKLPLVVPHSIFRVVREMSGSQGPQYLLKLAKQYGPMFTIRMPQFMPFCIVTSPKLARLILEGDKSVGVRGCDKGDMFKRFEAATGGYSTMFTRKTNQDWGVARKGCAPTFSKPNIDKLLPKINSKISEFCNIMDRFAESGKPCEHIETWFVRLTIDFISTTMLGLDFQTLSENSSDNDLKEVFVNVLPALIHEVTLKQVFNPLRAYCFWVPEVRKARKDGLKLISVAKKILEQHKNSRNSQSTPGECLLIDRMLKIPYKSDQERAADLIMMIVAGHDTTAFQISWAMIEIANHPHVLKKLQLELDNNMPGENDSLTAEVLNGMLFLDCIVKEVLRLWPVAAQGSIRETHSDIVFEETTIPKGSTVVMPFYAMFRTADIQDPEKFIPERWAQFDEDGGAEKMEELFFPFSAGKRNCIGQNLALWEMKHVLATIFHKFEVEFIGDLESDYFLTLRPLNANFKLSRRLPQVFS